MNTIRFAMFLFYNYYRRARQPRVPHFHMLCSMSFLAWMNIMTILCFLGKEDLFFQKPEKAFAGRFLLLITIIVAIFNFIGNEKKIIALSYPEKKRKIGGILLVLYFVLSMTMLIVGAWYASIK